MENNSKRLLCCIFIIVAGIFLSNCALGPLLTFDNEISQTSLLWGGYSKNNLYTLKHDIFIRENSKYTSKQLLPKAKILVPSKRLKQGGLYSAPESIAAFNGNPKNYPYTIGVVKRGTRIECAQIIEYVPVGYRNSLYIYATIKDGLYKGYLVEISALSAFYSKSSGGIHLKMPDPLFLQAE